MSTKIEWCDETLNPFAGCTKISEGCERCCALGFARRLQGQGHPKYEGVTANGGWTGRVNYYAKELDKLKHWKKPRRIFMQIMGDLFHPKITWDFDIPVTPPILQVFAAMNRHQQHTFMVLTKRPERMRDFCRDHGLIPDAQGMTGSGERWPLNVWAGVTAENQKRANERIPILLDIPAAVRFVSVEPALSDVDLSEWLWEFNPNYQPPRFLDEGQTYSVPGSIPTDKLHWVIWGPESGSGARWAKSEWRNRLYRQSKKTDIPFFDKTKLGFLCREWPREK